MLHGSWRFATLDATSKDSGAVGCQDIYLPLPAGWQIAPQDPDAIAVTAAHPWGTHLLVYADGGQRYTLNDDYSSAQGKPTTWYCCSDGPTALGTSSDGTQYKVNACSRRILLRAPPSTCTDAAPPPPFQEKTPSPPPISPSPVNTASKEEEHGSRAPDAASNGGGATVVSLSNVLVPILLVVFIGLVYYVWRQRRVVKNWRVFRMFSCRSDEASVTVEQERRSARQGIHRLECRLAVILFSIRTGGAMNDVAVGSSGRGHVE